MKKLISLIILAFLPLIASADAVEIGGIYYDFNLTNKTASVTKNPSSYSGVVVIPSEVTHNNITYSVTSIGDEAFRFCQKLTSVEIPNSVRSIGDEAFEFCRGLSSIDIPNCVATIGEWAFYGCSSITSLIIPKDLTSIGNRAFCGCSNLTSIVVEDENSVYDSREGCNAIIKTSENSLIVGCMNTTILSSVTSIDYSAFSDCIGLTSVTIPANLTKIRGNAFSGCIGLNSIIVEDGNPIYDSRDKCNAIIETSENELIVGCVKTIIPSSVTSIGTGAFSNLSGIASFEIPDCVTNIGYAAFSGCTDLKSVTIPSSVANIGTNAFYNCKALTKIDYFCSPTKIGEGIFDNCNNIWEVAFDCKKITPLFNGKSSLYKITLKENVAEVEKGAFKDCSNLRVVVFDCEKVLPVFKSITTISNVTLTENVRTIDELAFSGCSGLISLTIPKSLERIGGDAFSGCTNLDYIYISDLTAWCNIDFKLYNNGGLGASNPLNCFATHRSHRSQGNYPRLFLNGEEVINMVIPKGTNIRERAFQNFEGLESVTIYEGDESIGQYAFENCNYLTKATISQNTNRSAFENCTKLDSVIITEGVNTIGERAFFGSREMRYIQIPKSLKSMGSGAFSYVYYANYLSDMPRRGTTYVHISDLDTWSNGGFGQAFNDGYYLYKDDKQIGDLTITKNVSKIGDYAFRYCRNSFNKVTIEEGITSIGNYAFGGVDNNDYSTDGCRIRSIIIPNSITVIGNHAFFKCSQLDSVKLGNNVSSIGNSAFSKTLIKSIKLPEVISAIEDGVFDGCSNLKLVDIQGNITKIGKNAFRGTCIEKIDIPSTLTTIGDYAFSNTYLEEIEIPDKVTAIGAGAFSGCTNLSRVILPNSLKNIWAFTFRYCNNLRNIDIPNSVTYIETDAFFESGLRSARLGKNVTNINKAFHYCKELDYLIITGDQVPEFELTAGPTATDSRREEVSLSCQFIIPQAIYENGIPENVTNFATYQEKPVYVKVDKCSATTAELTLRPVDAIYGYSEDTIPRKQKMKGLIPNSYIKWELEDYGNGIVGVKTKELLIVVREPKALSTKKARLLATTDEEDDMEHFGFEWRRYDTPEEYLSNKVAAPLYNGIIVGTLSNLKDDIYYRYRPFYKSDSGEMVFGDWLVVFTGDADVYFEPEVYTKDAADITKVSALLAGVWFEGTDGFQEKGFEYWTVTGSKTRGVGSDVKKVVVSGNAMTATLEGLKAGATYGYRSYVKTTSGKTTYGEEKTFKTVLIGDVDGDGKLTNADADAIAKHVIGQTPTGFNKKMADLNDDGDVNVTDIVYLLNMIE